MKNTESFYVITIGKDEDEGGHVYSQKIAELKVTPGEPVYFRELLSSAKKANPKLPLLLYYGKTQETAKEVNPEDYFKGKELIAYLKDKIEILEQLRR